MQTPRNEIDWQAMKAAAARPEVDRAIRGIYAEVDQAIAQRGPTCWASGRCCNFDEYGHLLYVTALEIAWVVTRDESDLIDGRDEEVGFNDWQQGSQVKLPQLGGAGDAQHDSLAIARSSSTSLGPCIYQKQRLCSAHKIRPLGCRIFFCQQGTQDWQQDLYEQYLARLKELHANTGVEYWYLEWRRGLEQISRK